MSVQLIYHPQKYEIHQDPEINQKGLWWAKTGVDMHFNGRRGLKILT